MCVGVSLLVSQSVDTKNVEEDFLYVFSRLLKSAELRVKSWKLWPLILELSLRIPQSGKLLDKGEQW